MSDFTIRFSTGQESNSVPVGDDYPLPVKVTNGGGGGTSSNFGDPLPGAGTAAGAENPGGDMAPLHVDSDGNLLISGSISATNPSVGTNGDAAPGSSTEVGFISAGNLVGVSSANPLPITGSISASNPSVAPTGASVPADATYAGMDVGGNLVGLAGSANGLLVDGSGVTQPVAISQTTPGTTNAVEVTNLPTALDVNSGNKSNDTIRVVIATDQPSFANAVPVSAAALPLPTGAATSTLQTSVGAAAHTDAEAIVTTLGTPMQQTGGSVTANAGTNLNTSALALETGGNLAAINAVQGTVADTAWVSGNGTVIALLKGIFGKFGAVVLAAGTAIIGKVGIDQTTPGTTNGVALAQIAGTTVASGNGTSGAGNQRVNVASDNTSIANWGQGLTAAAVPAGAIYHGLLAKTANPAAATDGNLVGAMSDKLGRQVVTIGNVRDNKGDQYTALSSSSETTVVTAVASVFLDIYGCIVANTTGAAVALVFKDSTAGTTQFALEVPAGDTRGFMLPSSDGYKQTTVNNNWTCTGGASGVNVSMLYAKNI